MKIGIYTICKNEEKHIKRWFENLQQADVICVVDTGSTDNSLSIWQDLAQHHPNLHIKQQIFQPFYFDVARNAALDWIKEFLDETDIVFHFDLDELVEPNFLSEAYNQCQASDADIFIVNNGDSSNSWRGHRLLQNLRWQYHIHEKIIDIKNPMHRNQYYIVNTKFTHYPDVTKPRDYKRMLTEFLKQDPHSTHYMEYLLVEERKDNNFDSCVELGLNILKEVCINTKDEHYLDAQWAAYAAQDLIENYSAFVVSSLEFILKQTTYNLSKTFFTLLGQAYLKLNNLIKAEWYLLLAHNTPAYNWIDNNRDQWQDFYDLICFYYYNKCDYIAAYYWAKLCYEKNPSDLSNNNLEYCKQKLQEHNIFMF